MEDKGHCLRVKMIDRRTFPTTEIIILGMTGIEVDLPADDKKSNTKIEQEHPQEEDPILL